MRRAGIRLLAAVCILGACLVWLMSSAALAQEKCKAFLWDGTHWAQISEEAKAGYIFGMGNLADFEIALAKPESRLACISRAFVDELRNHTVMQVVQEIDKYYKENADKLKTPVIEVVLRKWTSLCPPEPGTAAKKK